jgi:thiol-disulfide isomerase/thioredoxin
VLVKIPRAVLFTSFLVLALGCARRPKEHPPGSASSPGQPSARASGVAETGSAPAAAAAPSGSTPSPDATVASPAPSAAARTGSSAYVGCGEPIPPARLWDETSEGEVLDAISRAKSCAAEHGRRLLLEFVAPWCADCQEMAKLDETALVAETLRRRFERVRVNVGKWDRHEALRNSFDVHALATYIVIDPKTSRLLAKTTLEPITKRGQKLSAEQWASWLEAH